MMTVKEFALEKQVTQRAVYKALYGQRIPGAYKDIGGWRIPQTSFVLRIGQMIGLEAGGGGRIQTIESEGSKIILTIG